MRHRWRSPHFSLNAYTKHTAIFAKHYKLLLSGNLQVAISNGASCLAYYRKGNNINQQRHRHHKQTVRALWVGQRRTIYGQGAWWWATSILSTTPTTQWTARTKNTKENQKDDLPQPCLSVILIYFYFHMTYHHNMHHPFVTFTHPLLVPRKLQKSLCREMCSYWDKANYEGCW